jgi:hypothetical protein
MYMATTVDSVISAGLHAARLDRRRKSMIFAGARTTNRRDSRPQIRLMPTKK